MAIMRVERTGGMVDDKPVYHLVGYDGDKRVVTIQVYPKNPTRWLNGNPNELEIFLVRKRRDEN